MIMELTNYKINKGIVTQKGKIVANVVGETTEALHAIWVQEGANPNEFYEELNGDVYRKAHLQGLK